MELWIGWEEFGVEREGKCSDIGWDLYENTI
jgi:hypothetical protein